MHIYNRYGMWGNAYSIDIQYIKNKFRIKLEFLKYYTYLCIINKNQKQKAMSKNTLVLEPSTNTHTINGEVTLKRKLDNLNGLVLECEGQGVVLHGEHGVVVTESAHVIKLTQQEVNPLTGQMVNAFD